MISRLALAFAAVLTLAACSVGGRTTAAATGTWERVKAAGILRVGIKSDTPPFGAVDGKGNYSGFDVDIAQAVAHQLGIDQVVFVPVTSANRVEKLLGGEVDVLAASMTITRTREKSVDFSIPYFQDGQSLLVPAASAITSYLDLGAKRVGAVEGSTSVANMRQVAPEATVVGFADFPALMDALRTGKVDAITSDWFILRGLQLREKSADSVRLAGGRFSTEPYGLAVAENQSDFRDAVSGAIQELWENGGWQTIHDTWFGPRTRFASDHRFTITPYPR